MIGIVDYEAGNIRSVANALASIGVQYRISSDRDELAACDGIILPGVGAAPKAMESLDANGLPDFLRSFAKPFLGICLGMELLYERSEEGDTPCLGVIPGRVLRFNSTAVKIPHMGWNKVDTINPTPLLNKTGDAGYFYFAHSFYSAVDEYTTGITESGHPFSSSVNRRNYFGVQFHPEKSGDAGLALLKNFDALCRSSRQ